MKRYENEEFISDEIQKIDEIQYFKAEEFKSFEHLTNKMENFKVDEIEKRTLKDTKKAHISEDSNSLKDKMNNIKSAVNSGVSTTVSVATVAVAAVGVGVVVPELVKANDNFGQVEFINYVIDVNESLEENLSSKDVKIYFNESLEEGYYCIVVNKDTKESKILETNYVEFNDLIMDSYNFSIDIMKEDKLISSSNLTVKTEATIAYQGVNDFDFTITYNEDNTTNLYMNLYEDITEYEMVKKITLYDKDGNTLAYESISDDNVVHINGISEKMYSAKAVNYLVEDGNYYPIYQYYLDDIDVGKIDYIIENNSGKLNLSILNEATSDVVVKVKYLDTQEEEVYTFTKEEINALNNQIKLSRATDIEVTLNGMFNFTGEKETIYNPIGKYDKYFEITKDIHIEAFSSLELNHIEILNSSYSYDYSSIPTQMYFDGVLLDGSYFDVNVYDMDGNLLDSVTNNTDIKVPVVFYNLDDSIELNFEYILYQDGMEIFRNNYITSVAMKIEYLDAFVEYEYINPGNAFFTFNEDNTYNVYTYHTFNNNSDYEVIHKVELAIDSVPYYYSQSDNNVTEILNVKANEYYSLIQKVFVVDGKNYYSIEDYVAVSGTIELMITEEGYCDTGGIYIEDMTGNIYNISTYLPIYSDAKIKAELSTGEVLEFNISQNSFSQAELPTIDLSAYTYDSVLFTVEFLSNHHYGDGDLIKETNQTILGSEYCLCICQSEFYN